MGDGRPEISNLWTASGRAYELVTNGPRPGTLQYIDRDYLFDQVPASIYGQTLIKVAGDDKMFEEGELCLAFDVDQAVTVCVLHADKFETKPVWLEDFANTGEKVTRVDSSDDTLKGIFTVFCKDFSRGRVELGGCLPAGFLTPAFRASGGTNYCMYSVVVTEQKGG